MQRAMVCRSHMRPMTPEQHTRLCDFYRDVGALVTGGASFMRTPISSSAGGIPAPITGHGA